MLGCFAGPPFTVKLLSPFNLTGTPKPWVVPTLSKVASDAKEQSVELSAAIPETPPYKSTLNISSMGSKSSSSATINNLFCKIYFHGKAIAGSTLRVMREGSSS